MEVPPYSVQLANKCTDRVLIAFAEYGIDDFKDRVPVSTGQAAANAVRDCDVYMVFQPGHVLSGFKSQFSNFFKGVLERLIIGVVPARAIAILPEAVADDRAAGISLYGQHLSQELLPAPAEADILLFHDGPAIPNLTGQASAHDAFAVDLLDNEIRDELVWHIEDIALIDWPGTQMERV